MVTVIYIWINKQPQMTKDYWKVDNYVRTFFSQAISLINSTTATINHILSTKSVQSRTHDLT